MATAQTHANKTAPPSDDVIVIFEFLKKQEPTFCGEITFIVVEKPSTLSQSWTSSGKWVKAVKAVQVRESEALEGLDDPGGREWLGL